MIIYLGIYKFFFCRSDHGSGENEVELLDTNLSSLPYELISEGKTAMSSGHLLLNIQLMMSMIFLFFLCNDENASVLK